MEENWVDIKDYEGLYQISDMGRVRGVDRVVLSGNGRTTVKGRVISLFPDGDGYRKAHLHKDGRRRGFKVHRLVLMHFRLGSEHLHADHLNGIRHDNRLVNLEWVTQAENNRRARKKGVWPKATMPRKLSIEQIREIRRDFIPNVKKNQIHKKYGVCQATVRKIANREIWGNID